MPIPAAPAPLLTPLIDGTRRVAPIVQAVLDTLAEDRALAAAGLTVTTYRHGYDESARIKPEPDVSELPYLRVEFAGGGMNWENEHQHRMEFRFTFHLFTAGPHDADMTNLMEAVVAALYPQDPDRRAAVFGRFRALEGLWRSKISGGLTAMGTIGMAAHGLKSQMQLQTTITLNT